MLRSCNAPAGFRPCRHARKHRLIPAKALKTVPASSRTPAADAAAKEASNAAAAQSLFNALSSASQFVNGIRLFSGDAPVQQPKQQQDAAQVPPDVAAFLTACSSAELRHMRKLVHLCSQTYYMDTLTPRKLERWHGLEMITSSLACERVVYEPALSPEETIYEGDGMAVSVDDAMHTYNCLRGVAAYADPKSNVLPLPRSMSDSLRPALEHHQQQQHHVDVPSRGQQAAEGLALPSSSSAMPGTAQSTHKQQQQAAGTALVPVSSDAVGLAKQQQQSRWGAADLVASKLSEAAAAASSAALQPLAAASSAALQPLASAAAAASTAAAAASSAALQPLASASSAALQPLASAAGSLYAGSRSLMAYLPGIDKLTAAAISNQISDIASAEVAVSHANSKEVKAASTSACPSDWYVADDPTEAVRYFVIQGSDSLEHWRTNITFEPMPFENTGVKVHRGAYEAALALYDRFLPLVQEAVDACPFGRVCFTGHSIGGSMATLLMLMFRARGVLTADQVAPTYTFGSPAIFCEGALRACGCGAAGCEGGCPVDGAPAGLLPLLDLPQDIIRNVFMSRDIVPRAFACDYTIVADLLRSWGPAWREHHCLQGSARKQMYAFVGQSIVMQPSKASTMFAADGPHPMLGHQGGAWRLGEPTLQSRMAAARQASQAAREGQPMALTRAASSTSSSSGCGGSQAECVEEALAALMDCPHPLDTLADPGAYMESGSISRYHNPDNYCRVLGRLLGERREQEASLLAGPSQVLAVAEEQMSALPVQLEDTVDGQGLGVGMHSVEDLLLVTVSLDDSWEDW